MKNLVIALSCMILLPFPVFGEAQPSQTIQIYIFYSVECPNCQAILQSYVPTLQSRYPFLDIETFDIGDPALYEALAKLEKKFNRRGQELPVVFIGDHMLSGDKEVMEKLDSLILEYRIKGPLAPILPPVEISPKRVKSEKRFGVELIYFYQKGCPKCDRAEYLIKYITARYPHLKIKEIDLSTADGKRMNETLSNRLGVAAEKRLLAPSIFVGEDYLLPEEITEQRVEALIEKYEKVEDTSALKIECEEVLKAEESMIQRFRSLGLATVLSAGFIDGLNPCAFATLIFFISYLRFVGRKRNEILVVGIGFSAAVFVTYLLIGLGILSFVQHLSFIPLFSRLVYWFTILFAVALGAVSLYDYIQLKRGRPSQMKLQLPKFLKKRIHRVIREEGRSRRYLLAAMFSGVIISLLEFTCTGQVYLPTILFVLNVPSMRMSAFWHLLLYNFMFVLPLLLVFAVVYGGATSEQLGFFLQRRASTVKFGTSLFFFGLAAVLFFTVGR